MLPKDRTDSIYVLNITDWIGWDGEWLFGIYLKRLGFCCSVGVNFYCFSTYFLWCICVGWLWSTTQCTNNTFCCQWLHVHWGLFLSFRSLCWWNMCGVFWWRWISAMWRWSTVNFKFSVIIFFSFASVEEIVGCEPKIWIYNSIRYNPFHYCTSESFPHGFPPL